MMLAPSASHLDVGDGVRRADLTLMRGYFVKPQAIVAMTFSDDPTLGLSPTASPVRPWRGFETTIVRRAHRRAALARNPHRNDSAVVPAHAGP